MRLETALCIHASITHLKTSNIYHWLPEEFAMFANFRTFAILGSDSVAAALPCTRFRLTSLLSLVLASLNIK